MHPDSDRLFAPAGIDTATFLRDYWQRRPLLLRGAIDATRLGHPDAAELAGLACDDGCESRIVRRHSPSDWELMHGPFDEDDFARLPGRDWTLLVQDVDKHLPEVAALLDTFRFLPDWRIDDIMISHAEDGGGVGPHTDAYDVFLVQARGKRRWRLSNTRYAERDLLPGLDIRVLGRFDCDEDWLLEPGDVLYLPPHLAHWGTAQGACLTWSVGFRSPDMQDAVSHWFDHLLAMVPAEQLPEQPIRTQAARLEDAHLAALRAQLEHLPGPAGPDYARWFGRYLTEPKPQYAAFPAAEPVTGPALQAILRNGGGLQRHPASRLAWQEEADGTIHAYCQGHAFAFGPGARDLIANLASASRCTRETPGALPIPPGLVDLVNAGCWEIEDLPDD